jgi:lipopolysaccharide export system protein LptA
MKNWKHEPLRVLVPVILGMILAGPVRAEEKQNAAPAANPMVIQSNTLEMNDVEKIVTFTGDVHAKRDDFTIACEKMVVFYDKAPSPDRSEEFNSKIKRIVATGKVRIDRAEGGTATAEKGEYFQDEEKLVLTGRPVVKQGNDFVEGNQITLFLRENRSVVEGSENQRVKAIIFPKGNER